MLKLLLVAALLLSGLHVGELAHAGENGLRHQLEHSSPMPEDPDDEGMPGHVSHAGHHHCPLAIDALNGLALTRVPFTGAKPCGRPVAALTSLSRAPPLQPPAA